MAYITVGSKFTPFTYEEKIRPFVQYNEAYSNIENTYNDLMTKADTVKASLNEEIDKESYMKYKDLHDELLTAADNLASQGLTKDIRKDLNNIYKNYRATILPIAKAIDVRDQEYKRRSEAKKADKSIKYEKENISIDDIVKNPDTYDFGREISINDLYNQVSKFSSPYADVYRGSSNWYSTADGKILERKDMYGYTEEEINNIINGVDKESPLAVQYNRFLKDLGVFNWEGIFDENGEYTEKGRDILNSINYASTFGLTQALGKPKFERVSNSGKSGGTDTGTKLQNKLKKSAIEYINFGKDQTYINNLAKNGAVVVNSDGIITYNNDYLPKPKSKPTTFYTSKDNEVSTVDDYNEYAANANLNASPIDIYKEWEEATKEDRALLIMSRSPEMYVSVKEIENRIKETTDKIKTKYNVNKILTTEEYNDITKTLESNKDLKGSYKYTAVSLSAISDSFPDKVNFNKNLKTILTSNVFNGRELAKDTIYELTEGLSGAKKKAASSDDFLNPGTDITDIKYSAQYPDSIIVTAVIPEDEGKASIVKHYVVKADAISASLAGLLKDYASIIEYSKNHPVEDWGDDVANAYYNIANAAAYILNPKD